MGLLEQIAAAAIRKRIISGLRDTCPERLREPLETLLADPSAISAIQTYAMAAMKNKEKITTAGLLALEFSQSIATLLQENPALVRFLSAAAASMQKK